MTRRLIPSSPTSSSTEAGLTSMRSSASRRYSSGPTRPWSKRPENIIGRRSTLVALVWTLGTMAGLYVIGRELFDRATGLIAALLYSVFQPWGELRDLAFNGEMVMNLPVVWAWAHRLAPQLFTPPARTLSRRPSFGRRISAQTAGRDRGGSARSLLAAAGVSQQSGFGSLAKPLPTRRC